VAGVRDFLAAGDTEDAHPRRTGHVVLGELQVGLCNRKELVRRPGGVCSALQLVTARRRCADPCAEVAPGRDANGTSGVLIDEGGGKLAVVKSPKGALAGLAASYRLERIESAAVCFGDNDEPLARVGQQDTESR
jgi:hypothetical protein